MRVNQYLSRAGVASRRKAEELITSGKVYINGEAVLNLATDILVGEDIVMIDGRQIFLPESKYYALNKPTGYTTTRSDPHATKTVFELLPDDSSLITVGRLDKETSGLLLITNDGDFAQNIIHPSQKIEKVYRVTLAQPLKQSDVDRLIRKVDLEDGTAHFTNLLIINPLLIEVGIEEGRNRIVRRMFQAVGNKVTALERLRIGAICLDIAIGKYRELEPEEIRNYA